VVAAEMKEVVDLVMDGEEGPVTAKLCEMAM
jgi:hypothetical protein